MGIPVLFFRSSSYTQWDYCAMSYYITYNLGYKQPTQKKANLGTITHKVLECLAQCKQRMQFGIKPGMRIEDGELGTIKFTEKKLNSNKFVIDLLDLAYKYYTEGDKHNVYDSKKDYDFCRQMVETCLQHNGGQFDPRKMRIVAPEKNFILDINEPWAKFTHEGKESILCIKGTMDLITEASPDTLEYVDYKTGARKDWATGEVKDYDKLMKDPQLLLYYYAISNLYPQYDSIIMSIFFLRDGGPFSLCFEKSDNDKFIEMLRVRFEEIRNCEAPKPINKWRNDFRCQKLCHYYKTKWPGTEISMCNYVEDEIKLYGIDKVNNSLKAPGFTLGYYSAPGQIQE